MAASVYILAGCIYGERRGEKVGTFDVNSIIPKVLRIGIVADRAR